MNGLATLTIPRSREIKKRGFAENMFSHILFYFKINVDKSVNMVYNSIIENNNDEREMIYYEARKNIV